MLYLKENHRYLFFTTVSKFPHKKRTVSSPLFRRNPISTDFSSRSPEALSLSVHFSIFSWFFQCHMQRGLNKSRFPPPPQIRSIPEGKLSVNTYKIGRLLMMINMATARAEMLQKVPNLRTHTFVKTFANTFEGGCGTPQLGAAAGPQAPLGRERREAAMASRETTRATDATSLLVFWQS